MILCKKMYKKSDHQLLRFPIRDTLNANRVKNYVQKYCEVEQKNLLYKRYFQRKRSKAYASF